MSGKSVVVSNTFTTWKELAPYIEFAVDNDIEIDITTMTNEYGSIHGVPEETMVRMRERFETETSIWEKVNAYRQ